MGCAAANCSKNDDSFRENGDEAFGWFFVCEYWPPGNVAGEDEDRYFEENVDPAVSGAIGVSYGRGMWLFVLVVVVLVQAGW